MNADPMSRPRPATQAFGPNPTHQACLVCSRDGQRWGDLRVRTMPDRCAPGGELWRDRDGSSGTRVDLLNSRVNLSSNPRKSLSSRGVNADSTRAWALRAGSTSCASNLSPDRVSCKLCRRRSRVPVERSTRPSPSNFLSTIPVVERSRPNRLATEIWSMPGRCLSTNKMPYCLLVTPSFPVSSRNNDTAI